MERNGTKAPNLVTGALFNLAFVLAVVIAFALPGHAKSGGPAIKKQSSLVIPVRDIGKASSVVVATNRWKPEKCMWVVKKEDISQADTTIIFPFEKLFNAVCHIIVGISETHYSFIHLTPLTSLFRRDTSELEKILTNLENITGKKQKWSFTVYNFADNGRELKFRNMIAKALKDSSLEFVQLILDNYAGGELNLLFADRMLSYSVKDLHVTPRQDASSEGIFNSIPISAIE